MFLRNGTTVILFQEDMELFWVLTHMHVYIHYMTFKNM